jgi:hypothetical protein
MCVIICYSRVDAKGIIAALVVFLLPMFFLRSSFARYETNDPYRHADIQALLVQPRLQSAGLGSAIFSNASGDLCGQSMCARVLRSLKILQQYSNKRFEHHRRQFVIYYASRRSSVSGLKERPRRATFLSRGSPSVERASWATWGACA